MNWIVGIVATIGLFFMGVQLVVATHNVFYVCGDVECRGK